MIKWDDIGDWNVSIGNSEKRREEQEKKDRRKGEQKQKKRQLKGRQCRFEMLEGTKNKEKVNEQ